MMLMPISIRGGFDILKTAPTEVRAAVKVKIKDLFQVLNISILRQERYMFQSFPKQHL